MNASQPRPAQHRFTAPGPPHHGSLLQWEREVQVPRFLKARLDCGPQWRDFLNFTEASSPDGVSLEDCFHRLNQDCRVQCSSLALWNVMKILDRTLRPWALETEKIEKERES